VREHAPERASPAGVKANRIALVNYLYKCGIVFPQSLDSSEYFFLTPSGSTPDVLALGDG
jgi:hypothetical protein